MTEEEKKEIEELKLLLLTDNITQHGKKHLIEIYENLIKTTRNRKAKVIENLEEEIKLNEKGLKYNNLTDYTQGRLDKTEEILEILKGENT